LIGFREIKKKDIQTNKSNFNNVKNPKTEVANHYNSNELTESDLESFLKTRYQKPPNWFQTSVWWFLRINIVLLSI